MMVSLSFRDPVFLPTYGMLNAIMGPSPLLSYVGSHVHITLLKGCRVHIVGGCIHVLPL